MTPTEKEAIEKLYDDLVDALRLCVINADTAAHYAGQKGGQADTMTLKNAPNWPGIEKARALLKRIDE